MASSNFTAKQRNAGPSLKKRLACPHPPENIWWSEDGKWGMCKDCTQTIYPDPPASD